MDKYFEPHVAKPMAKTGTPPDETRPDYQAEEFLKRAIRAEKVEKELWQANANLRLYLREIFISSGIFALEPFTIVTENGANLFRPSDSKDKTVGLDIAVQRLMHYLQKFVPPQEVQQESGACPEESRINPTVSEIIQSLTNRIERLEAKCGILQALFK
jgi:hypothetical protein